MGTDGQSHGDTDTGREALIIECSLNEQVTKAENASVPISVDEVIADGLAAAAAGAAILHFHARDVSTGDLLHPGTETYREIMRGIRRENPDVILYPTYGASPTPEERFSHLEALAADPETRLDFATIDPGAVNYADYDPETKQIGWDFVLSVTHGEIRYFFELCRRCGIDFSFTVRELGQIRHVLRYREMGLIADPLFFKLTMSEKHMWGVPPSVEGIRALRAAIQPPDVPYRWMLFIEGGSANDVDLFRYAVESGGHVRVGVGDTPLFGGRALTNAEQVQKVVAMAEGARRAVATPHETRSLLRKLPAGLLSTGSATA
jgi:3-keto-5-aminohexanoate cleavage enzyme